MHDRNNIATTSVSHLTDGSNTKTKIDPYSIPSKTTENEISSYLFFFYIRMKLAVIAEVCFLWISPICNPGKIYHWNRKYASSFVVAFSNGTMYPSTSSRERDLPYHA